MLLSLLAFASNDFRILLGNELQHVSRAFMSCCCQVICIKSDELVLEAFKRMKDNKIGGVPVVEEPGRKIVGNLSIKDIRFLLLQPNLFSNFR